MENKRNIISESDNSTVLTEYKALTKKEASYQSEAELETDFINILKDQSYEYLNINNEQDLIINLRKQLEKLNKIKFTDKEWNEFTVEMTTGGWDDGEGGEFEIEDEITLKMPTSRSCGLEVDFSLNSEDDLKWRQFLLAKGCDYRLKDNPYIENAVKI